MENGPATSVAPLFIWNHVSFKVVTGTILKHLLSDSTEPGQQARTTDQPKVSGFRAPTENLCGVSWMQQHISGGLNPNKQVTACTILP